MKPSGTEPPRLLRNGLDFVAEAVKLLRGEPTDRALKQAVIYLDAGVELVLKERLVCEHWALVFRELGAVRKSAFDSGDFQSASFDECIERLTRITGWDLTDRDHRSLRRFRRSRNKLMHCGLVDDPRALRAAAATALSILLDFVNHQFDYKKLGRAEETFLSEIREEISEFVRFVEHRWEVIQNDVSSAGCVVSECDSCGQAAVIAARSTDYECAFCGLRCTPSEAAEAYVSIELGIDRYLCMKEGQEWPISTCPSCDMELLIDRGGSGSMHPQEQFVCFGCQETWMEGSLRDCSRCGQLVDPGRDATPVCGTCWEACLED